MRILFVDDEQDVLDALRNLLRKQCREWDIVFALGGREALEIMAQSPVDAVVSDMRMPGMDGADLLTEVKRLYPATARIVLSGHAQHEMAVRAMRVSHQYLSKPCDAETLRRVIQRTADVCMMLADPALRDGVGSIESLPSLPDTYWALDRAIRDPNSNADDIAAIVESDPAMSAKVLQLVNSAYFGLPQQVSSIGRAVSYLGVDLLKGLTLATHLFSPQESISAVPGFSPRRLQNEALLTGRLAERFLADPRHREMALMGGLVHDIGHYVLAMVMPERFARTIQVAAATGQPDFKVEKELLGVSHEEIGAYLLSLWGLPFGIVETVAYHHQLPQQVEPTDIEAIVAVHVAGLLVRRSADVMPRSLEEMGLDLPAIERLGMTSEVARWEAMSGDTIERLRPAA